MSAPALSLPSPPYDAGLTKVAQLHVKRSYRSQSLLGKLKRAARLSDSTPVPPARPHAIPKPPVQKTRELPFPSSSPLTPDDSAASRSFLAGSVSEKRAPQPKQETKPSLSPEKVWQDLEQFARYDTTFYSRLPGYW